jgi:hypothetical protein
MLTETYRQSIAIPGLTSAPDPTDRPALNS